MVVATTENDNWLPGFKKTDTKPYSSAPNSKISLSKYPIRSALAI